MKRAAIVIIAVLGAVVWECAPGVSGRATTNRQPQSAPAGQAAQPAGQAAAPPGSVRQQPKPAGV